MKMIAMLSRDNANAMLNARDANSTIPDHTIPKLNARR